MEDIVRAMFDRDTPPTMEDRQEMMETFYQHVYASDYFDPNESESEIHTFLKEKANISEESCLDIVAKLELYGICEVGDLVDILEYGKELPRIQIACLLECGVSLKHAVQIIAACNEYVPDSESDISFAESKSLTDAETPVVAEVESEELLVESEELLVENAGVPVVADVKSEELLVENAGVPVVADVKSEELPVENAGVPVVADVKSEELPVENAGVPVVADVKSEELPVENAGVPVVADVKSEELPVVAHVESAEMLSMRLYHHNLTE